MTPACTGSAGRKGILLALKVMNGTKRVCMYKTLVRVDCEVMRK